MRRAAYENFFTELMVATKCLDVNKIEKYIYKSTSDDLYLITKQIKKANSLLNERYEHYGVITEQDNIDAFRKGYYDLGKISLTLDDMRKRVSRFEIDKDSPMGMQIEKNWNNAAFLLQDLLQLENMNLITYLRLLEERSTDVSNRKALEKKPNHKKESMNGVEANTINNSINNRMPSDIITIDEVCVLTRLSKSKIYHMTCNREIPHYKLDPEKKGRLLFSYSEIECWLKKKRVGTTEEFCSSFNNQK